MKIVTLALLAVGLSSGQEIGTIDSKSLAGQIFSASDDAARQTLLAAHQEQVGPALVKTMNEMAGKMYDARKIEDGLKMYTVSCGVASQVGFTEGVGTCTLGRGLCLYRMVRLDEALQHYDEALRLYLSIGQHEKASTALNAAGVLQRGRGRLKEAQVYLERAREEAELSGDEIAIAQSNTNLGNAYKALGRFTQAMQALEKALEITEKRHMDRQSAWILNNLGSVAFDEHDLEVALSYHQKSLAIKEKAGDPSDIASTLENLGTVYQGLGQYDKAIPIYVRAIELAEKGGALEARALALYNWGETLRLQNKLEEAKERLRAALAATEKYADRSLGANCKITLAEIAIDQRKFPEALAMVEPLVASARATGDAPTLIRALDVVGVARMSGDQLDQAEDALAEGIRTIEDMRDFLPGDQQSASAFFFGNQALHQHMVELQIRRKQPLAALSYAEKARGRALLDVLQSGKSDISKAMTAEEVQKEGALAKALAQRNDQLVAEMRRPNPDPKKVADLRRDSEQSRVGYRAFEVSLYARHPELKVQRVAFEPVSPADLAASVPVAADVAFLEYSVTDAATQLFVITAGGRLDHFRLSIGRKRLEDDVKQFRGKVATRDLDYRKLAASLYQALIAPAGEVLRGKKTIVIVPDDFLWQLPFQALMNAEGSHLLEDYAVSYAPSLSVLYQMRKVGSGRKPSVPRLLALEAAGVTSTKREIEGLRSLYGVSNTKTLAGGEADEESFRREASGYQVLHLAAHGVFNDASPMSSYLLVAKSGKPEAAMLEARQMMDLDLHAGIVVLSGCETGRGSSGSGEGLIGMSWALFIAGSPSTVASQWKVESNSTSDLMLALHRNLQRESKASALQHAAWQVMKSPEYRHPFYWSGFVLIGDGF